MTWPTYGETARRYSGNGTISVVGLEAPCRFDCAQLSDGRILLKCVCDKISDELHDALRQSFGQHQVALNGMTDEGSGFVTVEARGTHLNVSFPSRKLILEAITPQATIGTLPEGSMRLRFALTNFEFIGQQTLDDITGRVLALNVSDQEVVIERAPDYKITIERIRADSGIDITAALSLECRARDVDNLTDGLVGRLCCLLSLARGIVISWLSRDAYIGDELVQSVLRSSVVRGYSRLPAISPDDSDSTRAFIESGYDAFLRLEVDYSLREVIHAYCSARQPRIFTELRGLQAATLLDFLCGCHARLTGRAFVVDEVEFKPVADELQRRLRESLQELLPSADTSQIDEMVRNADSLSRRSFRALLRDLVREFTAPMTKQQINDVVNSRNSLVHEARFASDNGWREYKLLINTLDKILLRMLGYEGLYVDVANDLTEAPLVSPAPGTGNR